MGALNMTHSTCDGCGNRFPIRETHRWAYEFIVCSSCRVLCQGGVMSFRIEEIPWSDEVGAEGHCTDCDNLMAPSKYRIVNGVEECIFQRWATCKPCLDWQTYNN
jgi:hypothetical protein